MSGALSIACLTHAQAMVKAVVPGSRWVATSLYAAQSVAILPAGVAADKIGLFHTVALVGAMGVVCAVGLGVWCRGRSLQPEPETVKVAQMSLFPRIGTSSRPHDVTCHCTIQPLRFGGEAFDNRVPDNVDLGFVVSDDREPSTTCHGVNTLSAAG